MWSDTEQTRNGWMWAARNLDEKVVGRGGSQIHGSKYSHESWEERAFAEDSAGHLGGCVWPPRSYPCSFCKREFRSAQALGGHMNVHRRDRARLKESLSPADDGSGAPDPPLIERFGGGRMACASSAPLPDLSPRVSAAAGARQCAALFSPPCKSPSSVSVMLESVPAAAGRRLLSSRELKLGSENSSASDRNMYHSDKEEEEGEEEQQHIGIKRRRTEIEFSEKVQSDQVLKQSSWPVEELDLELRLGQKKKTTCYGRIIKQLPNLHVI